MTTTDHLIDSALVLLVLLQIRERPLTTRMLVRPLVIVGIAVASYLHGIPTAGNDLLLAGALGLLGALIGLSSGQTVLMRRNADGSVLARSGWVSGFFWVLGMGSRFAFIYWITHSGAATIAHFSASHSITSSEAWTVALLAASNSRQTLERADQAELLLAQTQRSHEEQLRAARLEESTRIAREIHDVLAHALDYRAGTDAVATLTMDGDLARLGGTAGETIARVTQEALTNARKHAPGAGVAFAVHAGERSDDDLVLVIDDRERRVPPFPRPPRWRALAAATVCMACANGQRSSAGRSRPAPSAAAGTSSYAYAHDLAG